ncbi:hypothetical protein JCM8547_005126 [Rhodosporidiobolus lusitaniae]
MSAPYAPYAPSDVITQSNYQEIRTKHIALEWTVDWSQRIVRGTAIHTLSVLQDGTDKAAFDTSYLSIKRAYLASDPSKDLSFSLPSKRNVYGSALTVDLDRKYNSGDEVELVIEYATTDRCTALGWLEKEQTDSGKYPFMFSQCQAIHARSLLPCQDTSAVKLTYSARVTSTLPVLLSALRTSPPLGEPEPPIDGTSRTYEWNQPVPIPSYLIAIAGGELEFRSLGKRTGIWAEPGVVEKAKWEFEEDAEKIVNVLEDLLTPYSWGRYDALVLPASFPYGGMENPTLTFLTPALVVGDRSQVDVLAHECAHSWHGNLIGCANWDSFWLNEGWTTYTERLVALKLHGHEAREFEYVLGAKSLRDDLERFEKGEKKGQRLHIPYVKGEDPDDLYSGVAYDKGANFLLYLERLVGGLEVFNPYHKDYVKTFSGKVLTTAEWEKHFWSYWSQFPEREKILKEKVDWNAWLNGEGLELPVKMEYDLTLATACYTLAKKWLSVRNASRMDLRASFSKSDLASFSATQIVVFLETMGTYDAFRPSEGSHVVEVLGEVYGVKESTNPEIALRFLLLALKAGECAEEASVWVRNKGRMKYARPTYRALNDVNPTLAKETFLKYGKGFLHPIARQLVAKDLGLEAD